MFVLLVGLCLLFNLRVDVCLLWFVYVYAYDCVVVFVVRVVTFMLLWRGSCCFVSFCVCLCFRCWCCVCCVVCLCWCVFVCALLCVCLRCLRFVGARVYCVCVVVLCLVVLCCGVLFCGVCVVLCCCVVCCYGFG